MSPTTCPRCGSGEVTVNVQDVSYNNGEYPPNDFITVDHCICNKCLEEWIE